jgi:hypothetical protein
MMSNASSRSAPGGEPATQPPAVVVEQQDGRRVGVEDVAGPMQQLRQQIAPREVRERRVRDALERLEVRRSAGGCARAWSDGMNAV